jgi:broad specificity phosphatase PhoE
MRVGVVLLVAVAMMLGTPVNARDVWQNLRDDTGLVVLMRHAIAPGGGDPAGFRLGECSTQRLLSAEGRAQARRIGKQFRERNIPISQIRSSRWCRAEETARLLNLGPVLPTPALDSVFTASSQVAQQRQRQAERLIRQHRGKQGVLVLVGHQANITDLTGISPASGASVVVRADRNGTVRVVGQLPAPPGG